jgi:urease accessory protein
MYAAGSPSEVLSAAVPLTAHHDEGEAVIGFALRDGRTRLADLYQRPPLRVLWPHPAEGDLPQAAIVNTGGGLVAGDSLRVTVRSARGTRALVMAQAAEKVYRSTGGTARIETDLSAERGAWLEWLPQETILFADGRLSRRLRLDLAADARCMAGEILVFGRLARGERTRTGYVRDAIELRRDGRLVWADALHLDGDYGPVLDSRAGFGGAAAAATFLYTGPDAPDLLATARELLDDTGLRAAATCVNGVLVARWLAHDPQPLRRSFGAFWAGFRHAAAGLPPRLPRLWEV